MTADEPMRVIWLPPGAIADPQNPTAAELAGGFDLSEFVTDAWISCGDDGPPNPDLGATVGVDGDTVVWARPWPHGEHGWPEAQRRNPRVINGEVIDTRPAERPALTEREET